MKITNLQLKKALSIVNASVKERSPLPYYAHVFFVNRPDAPLALAAFDGATYIQTNLAYEKITGKEDGFSMPYKTLAQFIEKTGAEKVEFDFSKDVVKVRVDNFTMQSKTLPLENLANVDAPPESPVVSLDSEEFIINAERALMSASSDANDVTLASLIVLIDNGKATFMGFDRFRLSLVNSMETRAANGMWSISASVTTTAIKAAKNHKTVKVYFNENKVWFYFDDGETFIVSALSPNIKGMPKLDTSKHGTIFSMDTADFRRAIEVANIFSGDSKIIVVNSDGKTMTVKNDENAGDSDSGTSVLPVEVTDDKVFMFRMNAKAVLDFLGVARSVRVGARYLDEKSLIQFAPMRLKAGDEIAYEFEEGFEYVVAPYFVK